MTATKTILEINLFPTYFFHNAAKVTQYISIVLHMLLPQKKKMLKDGVDLCYL